MLPKSAFLSVMACALMLAACQSGPQSAADRAATQEPMSPIAPPPVAPAPLAMQAPVMEAAYAGNAKMARMVAIPGYPMPPPTNTETYERPDDNPVKQAAKTPLSTFSIDVDTGSYSNVRRMLTTGVRPPADAVRAEEFIN